MKFGSLVVDTNRRQVSRAGERISLTYTEFSLLELLFDEPSKVVPRAEIRQLWVILLKSCRFKSCRCLCSGAKVNWNLIRNQGLLTVGGYASQRVGETATSLAS